MRAADLDYLATREITSLKVCAPLSRALAEVKVAIDAVYEIEGGSYEGESNPFIYTSNWYPIVLELLK